MQKPEYIKVGKAIYTVLFLSGNRKNISLLLTASDVIRVKYPAWMTPEEIRGFVKLKRKWIEKKSRLLSEAEAAGVGQGLIRVSVGLEHLDDLKADLSRGLDTL